MGRRKNTAYIPYDQASTVAKMEQIQSRSQYWKWWNMYQPKDMPKRPDKVYSEWVSWNDFLGTSNKFKHVDPHEFRSYEEALVYARTSHYQTCAQWFKGEHPSDVPVRPDIVYKGKGFKGWGHFLGKKQRAVGLTEMRSIGAELNVLLFALPYGNPPNVLYVGVHPGVAAARDFMAARQMQPVKMFKMEDGYEYKSVLEKFGFDYGEGQWLFENVDQAIFEIDLEWV